jgi:hypothetical protein
MELLPQDLRTAASAARERFARFSQSTAEANAAPGAALPASAMAGAARAAIFADAVLGALHARLEELKNAAK